MLFLYLPPPCNPPLSLPPTSSDRALCSVGWTWNLHVTESALNSWSYPLLLPCSEIIHVYCHAGFTCCFFVSQLCIIWSDMFNKLFGYLAPHVISSKFFSIFNKLYTPLSCRNEYSQKQNHAINPIERFNMCPCHLCPDKQGQGVHNS